MERCTDGHASRRTVLQGSETGAPGVCLLGHHRNFTASVGIAPHRHTALLELVYVVSGEICFEAQGCRDVLHGGDMYLTQPGQLHSTGASPTGVCEFYWLHLDATGCECLGLGRAAAGALLGALRGIRRCALYGQTRWDKAFASLLETLTQPRPHDTNAPQDMTALYAACALLPVLCDAVQRAGSARRYTPDIEAALHFVHANLTEELPLTALAQAAGLSVPRLKAKFMQQVGVPPRAYWNLAKIEAAKQMLCAGDSVTDTAFHFGFSSSGYFSTQFKKFTGQTPTRFRQAALQA